jgi:dihydroneopterin aldolase
MNFPREAECLVQGSPYQSVQDAIFIRQLRLDARIGVYEWEKKCPQPVIFDLELALPSRLACQTDRIEDAVDYGEVIQLIRSFSLERSFDLVEAMAEALAEELMRRFAISKIYISITKVVPFPGVEVGVWIVR